MKYLNRYADLLESHQDVADYERFYKHCLKCIKDKKQDHGRIFRLLRESLRRFNSPHLISMTLRLISNLDFQFDFTVEELRNYLKNESTRTPVLTILQKINNPDLNREALSYLYDGTYESKEFFVFLSNFEKDVTNFLNIKDSKFLRRQLLVMNYTRIFKNLDYFITYLGSNDRSICYLVYESIILLIRDKFKNEPTKHPKPLGDSSTIWISNNEGQKIRFTKQIEVDNVSNFLIYFLPFLEQSESVYSAILEHKVDYIEKILSEYVIYKERLQICRHKHLYSTYCRLEDEDLNYFDFVDEDTNFDFLFEELAFKSHTDCVEL